MRAMAFPMALSSSDPRSSHSDFGPCGEEEHRPVGREEGIEDAMSTALALPRGRVGTANLPGTAAARNDGGPRRVARDLILQGPELVVSQPQVSPVFRERSDVNEVIKLCGAPCFGIDRPIGLLSCHRDDLGVVPSESLELLS